MSEVQDSNGKRKLIIIGVIVVIFLSLISSAIGTYNSLVTSQEKIQTSSANISTQLQRRTDLIPNLINTVKGYVKHESEVMTNVTKARQNLMQASNMTDRAKANEELTQALHQFNIFVENYPNLKADSSFVRLQDELAGTENRIATARRDYNESVRTYNQTIKTFPENIYASIFNFKPAPYFEAKPGSEAVPDVKF